LSPISPNSTRFTVLSVFGTRPEAIKMAPVVKALEADPHFRSLICVTGQHRLMLDQVLQVFGIRPDFDLDVMMEGQDLAAVTTAVLTGLQGVLAAAAPDLVLVHGDTTTTMAAALASYYRGIPVGHVEAGLRTYNKRAPFPEEINRRVAGVIADLHFAPTLEAERNLLSEGVPRDCVFVTGNTVVDAVLHARSLVGSEAARTGIAAGYPFINNDRRMVLVTGHRRENFGEDLEQICLALTDIAAARPDVEFVYPVHLNPNVREAVHRIIGQGHPGIHLVEPADYLSFLYLIERSYLILTDSGGIQEEAPTFGKPVLVMRKVTERREALEAGTARLVGTDRGAIVKATLRLLDDRSDYASMANRGNPFGDGRAAGRIVAVLRERAKRV
jgi:UDP-N-acetylglucosamine 2-epimerase (non-hydrolysing)